MGQLDQLQWFKISLTLVSREKIEYLIEQWLTFEYKVSLRVVSQDGTEQVQQKQREYIYSEKMFKLVLGDKN